jgi:hypothetical protein
VCSPLKRALPLDRRCKNKKGMDVLLIGLLMILWFGFVIFPIIAVNKVKFLYNESEEKLGVKLKRRTWGPSLRDMKNVFEQTKDMEIRDKVGRAIKFWNYAIISFISFVAILFLLFVLPFFVIS